jgi:hypothetical protein
MNGVGNNINDKTYITEIFNKFNFLIGVLVTDQDGGTILSNVNEEFMKKLDNSSNSKEQKMNLSFVLTQFMSSSVDQLKKIEKLKTQFITVFYNDYTIFQSNMNKNYFIHLICDNKELNYELAKEIIKELASKLTKIEKEIESLGLVSVSD